MILQSRPCNCRRITPGNPWKEGECVLCWHAEHTAKFREAWGITGPPPPSPPPPPSAVSVTCTSSPVPASAGPGLPATVNFSCTVSGGTPGYTYLWTFWGTVSNSVLPNPTVLFPNPGGAGTGKFAHLVVTDSLGATGECYVGPFSFG